ncbi:hypothetical protein SAMN06297382_2806 [Amphiplicatus metriothermophilus]|uniref:Uncharacterized protein n=2 Tax=Amphiplicatus metriothermophilus TaxID=1519374 RepID=A0A239Q015_9PROT|nr:hypothetical protein SAMN06297382_2806 [Amphiplicatus metriothermophilus]
MTWLWLPLILILFVGGAFSIAVYMHEPSLSAGEAFAVGFGGLAALIAGLFASAVGVIVGLFGALIGLVAAGGAIAMTLFIIASPILAIVLLFLLLRRRKNECPDPSVH